VFVIVSCSIVFFLCQIYKRCSFLLSKLVERVCCWCCVGFRSWLAARAVTFLVFRRWI
jgi:hypothetical protein